MRDDGTRDTQQPNSTPTRGPGQGLFYPTPGRQNTTQTFRKKMKEEKGEKIRKRNKRKITTCSVSTRIRFRRRKCDAKKGGSVCCTGV